MDLVETGSFETDAAISEHPERIRVVSWNINRGSRLKEVTEFLCDANVDLILLQETDSNARRTGHLNVAAEIARALRMNYAFGVEFEELSQGVRGSPAYHGQTTLSRFPISDSRILRFRRQSRFWNPYWCMPNLAVLQRRLGGRMALLSHIGIGEGTLAAYNLHLESRSEDIRRAQLAELLAETRRYDADIPTVVAGDFNFDVTESSAASAIRDVQLQNPFEREHSQTTRRRKRHRNAALDWILIREPLHAVGVQVHNSVSASDHYPVSLTLELSNADGSTGGFLNHFACQSATNLIPRESGLVSS